MQKVYELVRLTVPVSQLDAIKRGRMIKALLLRITTITGWIMPENELGNILIDQFGKIICEQYGNLNNQEIEYAFRQFGLTVKDWGKEMNLSMIHEVLSEYLNIRSEVSKWDEHHQPVAIENKEDLGDTAMQEWYESTARQVMEGRITLEFVPPMLYDWLCRKEEITDSKTLHKAAALKIGQRLAQDQSREGIAEANRYRAMWKAGVFTGKYITEIEKLAKSIAVWNHILKNA